jgi:elongation factor G
VSERISTARVETIIERLRARPVAIQIPVGAEDKFAGVVDLVTMKARIWRDETLGAKYDDVDIPADLQERAQEYRDKLIEAVSESDDALFEKYIEGTPITEAELVAGIRKATIGPEDLPRDLRLVV